MNKIIFLIALLFNSLVFASATNLSKVDLEKLSDSELILKAIGSGFAEKIEFGGSQALDNSVPSYKKELVNKEEIVDLLLGIKPEKPEKPEKQAIEIEADSVMVDETSGLNEFIGHAEVRQGSLVIECRNYSSSNQY